MSKVEQKDKSRNVLIILFTLVLVVSVSVTIGTLFFQDKPISPDYPPQGTEEHQKPLEGDDGEKIESPSGGGAINVTFHTNATVDLSEEKVTLFYANPQASNHNVAILIMIDELVIAKSELITPGNGVDELKLEPSAKDKLQVGGYDAILNVRAYDPVSGEKAMIDTNGELTVTVQE